MNTQPDSVRFRTPSRILPSEFSLPDSLFEQIASLCRLGLADSGPFGARMSWFRREDNNIESGGNRVRTEGLWTKCEVQPGDLEGRPGGQPAGLPEVRTS